jgi:hypothetical protein
LTVDLRYCTTVKPEFENAFYSIIGIERSLESEILIQTKFQDIILQSQENIRNLLRNENYSLPLKKAVQNHLSSSGKENLIPV